MNTSKEQLAGFSARVKHYVKMFGINEWDISFTHEKLSSDTICATCNTSFEDKDAIFTLNAEINDSIIVDLESIAKHEALELLLADLNELASRRGWDEEAWNAARHTVINRIMNYTMGVNNST